MERGKENRADHVVQHSHWTKRKQPRGGGDRPSQQGFSVPQGGHRERLCQARCVSLYISLPSQLHLPLKAQTRRRAGLSNLEGWCQNTRERARGFWGRCREEWPRINERHSDRSASLTLGTGEGARRKRLPSATGSWEHGHQAGGCLEQRLTMGPEEAQRGRKASALIAPGATQSVSGRSPRWWRLGRRGCAAAGGEEKSRGSHAVVPKAWRPRALANRAPCSWLSLGRSKSCPPRTTSVPLCKSASFSKFVKVAQSCPTLCNPMDCGPPGPSVRGIPQLKFWSGLHILLQGIFLTQELNPGVLYCRRIVSYFKWDCSKVGKLSSRLLLCTNDHRQWLKTCIPYLAVSVCWVCTQLTLINCKAAI